MEELVEMRLQCNVHVSYVCFTICSNEILFLIEIIQQEILQFTNFDLSNICTPVSAKEFNELLERTNYEDKERRFLIKGFTTGFSLKYRGSFNRTDLSDNIPFTPGVGNRIEMWNKIMKEVKNKRYAGPFEEIPFNNYAQSPIGLVPEDGGAQTRLIFHLSYEFPNGNKSINQLTSREYCSVRYNDIDHAMKNCIYFINKFKDVSHYSVAKTLFLGKTDLKRAFRQVPLKGKMWPILIMKATCPSNGKTYFFVDKCFPFGASISCSHFQRLSNALRHIVETLEKSFNSITNYL